MNESRPKLSERFLGVEGSWLMGRVMPRELLEGIDQYLRRELPASRTELMEAIRVRAEELQRADQDLPVDRQSEGMLALTATVQASYEQLLPAFDEDQERTILFLQHVFGTVLRRPFQVTFGMLGKREDPLEAIDRACRKEVPLYGDSFEITFDRSEPDTLEMRVGRCFFRDYFARHDNPLLTTVLCAWDANWMQAVDPAVSGLRAERTSLLSLGDDACRFRVLRTGDPLASYEDALNQRFSSGEGPSSTSPGSGDE